MWKPALTLASDYTKNGQDTKYFLASVYLKMRKIFVDTLLVLHENQKTYFRCCVSYKLLLKY